MKPCILRLKSKIMKRILATLLVGVVLVSCKETVYKDKIYEKPEFVREAPSDFLSPEESMETFYLPEGYKVELVASYLRGMNDETALHRNDVRNVRRDNKKEGYWALKELQK